MTKYKLVATVIYNDAFDITTEERKNEVLENYLRVISENVGNDDVKITVEMAVVGEEEMIPEPCGFCGDNTNLTIEQGGITGRYYVVCHNCGACGPSAEDKGTSIVKWNTRVCGCEKGCSNVQM